MASDREESEDYEDEEEEEEEEEDDAEEELEYEEEDDLNDVYEGITEDDIELLKQALETGININVKFAEGVSPEHEGMTPLALASAYNKVEAAKMLLKFGANISDTFTELDTTALMTASFHGHSDIVRILLRKGADVKAVDRQSSTALGYAFGGTREVNVITQLLRAGVDVNQKNMLGMSALLLVAGYGDDRMVKMVLDSGSDAHAVNEFGHTALHLAIVGKRSQMKTITSGQTGAYGLNRRNIDAALKEWSKQHRDVIHGIENDKELEVIGQFMMNIGSKLDDPDNAVEDDHEAMKRRVEAVWRYRQEEPLKMKKPRVFNGLMACSGKNAFKAGMLPDLKSKPVLAMNTAPAPTEVQRNAVELSDRCTRVLRLLIEARCPIEAMDKTFGVTALDMAILLGDVESTVVLMAAGADARHLMKMSAQSDLYESIAHSDKKRVKDLVTHDHDIDVNEPFTQFSKHPANTEVTDLLSEGMTPLAVAAQKSDVEALDIIKMLLKSGAQINNVGPSGSTPLAEAIRVRNLKMVEFLVGLSADIEITNPAFQNGTAVVVAVMLRQKPVVDFLIQKSAKIDKLLSDNTSALMKAAENKDSTMVETLLNAPLSENFFDKGGFTYEIAEKYQKLISDNSAIDITAIMTVISSEMQHPGKTRLTYDMMLKKPDVALDEYDAPKRLSRLNGSAKPPQKAGPRNVLLQPPTSDEETSEEEEESEAEVPVRMASVRGKRPQQQQQSVATKQRPLSVEKPEPPKPAARKSTKRQQLEPEQPQQVVRKPSKLVGSEQPQVVRKPSKLQGAEPPQVQPVVRKPSKQLGPEQPQPVVRKISKNQQGAVRPVAKPRNVPSSEDDLDEEEESETESPPVKIASVRSKRPQSGVSEAPEIVQTQSPGVVRKPSKQQQQQPAVVVKKQPPPVAAKKGKQSAVEKTERAVVQPTHSSDDEEKTTDDEEEVSRPPVRIQSLKNKHQSQRQPPPPAGNKQSPQSQVQPQAGAAKQQKSPQESVDAAQHKPSVVGKKKPSVAPKPLKPAVLPPQPPPSGIKMEEDEEEEGGAPVRIGSTRTKRQTQPQEVAKRRSQSQDEPRTGLTSKDQKQQQIPATMKGQVASQQSVPGVNKQQQKQPVINAKAGAVKPMEPGRSFKQSKQAVPSKDNEEEESEEEEESSEEEEEDETDGKSKKSPMVISPVSTKPQIQQNSRAGMRTLQTMTQSLSITDGPKPKAQTLPAANNLQQRNQQQSTKQQPQATMGKAQNAQMKQTPQSPPSDEEDEEESDEMESEDDLPPPPPPTTKLMPSQQVAKNQTLPLPQPPAVNKSQPQQNGRPDNKQATTSIGGRAPNPSAKQLPPPAVEDDSDESEEESEEESDEEEDQQSHPIIKQVQPQQGQKPQLPTFGKPQSQQPVAAKMSSQQSLENLQKPKRPAVSNIQQQAPADRQQLIDKKPPGANIQVVNKPIEKQPIANASAFRKPDGNVPVAAATAKQQAQPQGFNVGNKVLLKPYNPPSSSAEEEESEEEEEEEEEEQPPVVRKSKASPTKPLEFKLIAPPKNQQQQQQPQKTLSSFKSPAQPGKQVEAVRAVYSSAEEEDDDGSDDQATSPIRAQPPAFKSSGTITPSAKLQEKMSLKISNDAARQPPKTLKMPAKLDFSPPPPETRNATTTNSTKQQNGSMAPKSVSNTQVRPPAGPQKGSAANQRQPMSSKNPTGRPPPLPFTRPPVNQKEEVESEEESEGEESGEESEEEQVVQTRQNNNKQANRNKVERHSSSGTETVI